MNPDRRSARFAGRAMGSPLALTVVGLGSGAARRAWEMVAADIEQTEASISRWRAESGLSRLNSSAGSGRWAAVDRRLFTLLAASSRAQRLSGGRFDARVISRLEALGEQAGVPLPPAPNSVGDDSPWMVPGDQRRTLQLHVPVDSGGIGKGLALRWALAALRRADLLGHGVLLEAGGDLVASGEAPGAGPWQIGIENPADSDAPLAVISVSGGAVATSSTAVRRWTTSDGRAVHHLIDPSTGEPGGDGLVAVTVAAADPAWAEVWSKTLFLAGSRLIGDEARRRGLAAWWVEADGSLHLTPAARPRTAWTSADRAA